MSAKIRMNTEYRNKFYNRIKDVFEKEETQEQQAFLQAREDFNDQQKLGFELAKAVVERSYPKEDVATLRTFKKKYGDPCDVVAKDKCFYFSHNEDVDDEGESKETKSHFDFGLHGNLNGNESYSNNRDSDHFAHAYFREELKEKGCNPDIIAQQSGKDENPHKTKHIDLCNKALGKESSGYSQDSNAIGMTKDFNAPFYADVIGTSYCRSRAIACTKEEYNLFLEWRSAKAKVVSTHQTWINSIMKQCDQLKIGLKAYRYLSEGIELAKELGIELDEAELIKTNSTGLTIYNPTNLANMIKGMKNKEQTREQKIYERMKYEKESVN